MDWDLKLDLVVVFVGLPHDWSTSVWSNGGSPIYKFWALVLHWKFPRTSLWKVYMTWAVTEWRNTASVCKLQPGGRNMTAVVPDPLAGSFSKLSYQEQLWINTLHTLWLSKTCTDISEVMIGSVRWMQMCLCMSSVKIFFSNHRDLFKVQERFHQTEILTYVQTPSCQNFQNLKHEQLLDIWFVVRLRVLRV